jgi:hypothetical protein
VIVQARIGDQLYWLDPTRAPQSGTIQTIFQPDYGQALLVNATTRELSSMEAKLATRVLTKRIVAEYNARDGLATPKFHRIDADRRRGSRVVAQHPVFK